MTLLRAFLAVLLGGALALSPPRALAADELVVSFEDPAGDATGPGTYTPPRGAAFAAGDFDLRRFAVYRDGDEVRLEVTLGAPIRRPASAPDGLANGIWVQNVDVYVDSEPGAGRGSSAGIPGRRIAFAGGRTWETAVVLTPQPEAFRAALAKAMGQAAARVFVPGPLEVRGSTIVARVPAAALGGLPRDDWGWSVQVSGARWVRPSAPGADDPEAFVLPVLPVAGDLAFGGAPTGEVHPRIVDVLLPPGADQAAVLSSFDAATGAFARVPFVHAAPAPAARGPAAPLPSLAPRLTLFPKAAPPSSPLPLASEAGGGAPRPAAASGQILTVAEMADDVVTLAGSNVGLVPLQAGRVLGRDGATVGHVVIDKVLENGAVGRVVSGRENVRWGSRVRFEPPAAKR